MATFFNVSQLPLLEQADLLIVGGGSAGCLAALAARRAGIDRVLLIERYGFAGGTSTQMLDTFYGFFTPGTHPRKIVGGLPDVVVDELEKTDDVFAKRRSRRIRQRFPLESGRGKLDAQIAGSPAA